MDSMYALDLSSNLFFGILPGQWAKDGYFPNLKLLALNNNPMLIGAHPTRALLLTMHLPPCCGAHLVAGQA
jgi:hypothetical protein